MRLIDADKLKELYQEYKGYTHSEVILQNIDDQPTAYDIDEAIKQYEKGFDDGFTQASEIGLQDAEARR